MAASEEPTATCLGAYGFRLEGVDSASPLLGAAEPDWPRLELITDPDEGGAPDVDFVDEQGAQLRLLAGGWIELERARGRVTFHVPETLPAEAIIHPYLASAAALAAWWQRWESIHAGAFVAGDGACALIGEKDSGKSSTLAALAHEGHTILSDDVLVIHGGAAFAGPRCVDLRSETARRLNAGEPLGQIGLRERWRYRVGSAPAKLPMRAWVSLGWGPDTTIRRLDPAACLATLAGQRVLGLPVPDPGILLELSGVPCWELRRPREWDSMGEALALLLDTVAG
jgi:hypothetical protein